jgi:hypothetical protein
MGLEFSLWFEFTRFLAEEGLLKLIRQEGAEAQKRPLVAINSAPIKLG